jgi:DNA-binding transcriptional LysR family regulator
MRGFAGLAMQKSGYPGFDLSWNDLQFFLVAARAGSAAEAGRRLHIDQATVSRRIRRLESMLGRPLLERGPQGHVLTQDGQALLGRAETMEGNAFAILDYFSDGEVALNATVRIAGPEGFLCAYLAPRLAPLRAKNPGLNLQLVPMPHLMSVSKREFDIAITVGQVLKGRAVTRKLTDYSLGLFASEAYLRAHAPIVSVAQLGEHPLIGYVDDLIIMPDLNYLGEIAPTLRARVQSTSLLAQRAMAEAGLGLCVLPYFMAADSPTLRPVLPDEVRLTRSYWLVVHADTKDLAAHRAIIDFIAGAMVRDRPLLL